MKHKYIFEPDLRYLAIEKQVLYAYLRSARFPIIYNAFRHAENLSELGAADVPVHIKVVTAIATTAPFAFFGIPSQRAANKSAQMRIVATEPEQLVSR
ncbi:MAG: hypothetical protein NC311_07795 [Muribaculaceae bacterium]|nr:hypothetical protein [Muribaculaceae bacterium]